MPSIRGGGMNMRAETGRGVGARGGSSVDTGAKKKKVNFRRVWPTVWNLVKPRSWMLAVGFVLVVIKTVSGLAMPYLSKYLLDGVLATAHPHPELLPKLIWVVLIATIVQAIVSFALTQLLSTEGQKLISELRRQVQAHVGRLSVSYYDTNRTGTLVSRIMTDVEGVRNLIGTGLVN